MTKDERIKELEEALQHMINFALAVRGCLEHDKFYAKPQTADIVFDMATTLSADCGELLRRPINDD